MNKEPNALERLKSLCADEQRLDEFQKKDPEAFFQLILDAGKIARKIFYPENPGDVQPKPSSDEDKTTDWPSTLAPYITNSIQYYLKWLDRERPEKIELVFHKHDYIDELEPAITIFFPSDSVLLDYEDLRYGHLLPRDRDGQKECVCEAEAIYPEFREAVASEEEVWRILQETAKLVGESTQIPTSARFVD